MVKFITSPFWVCFFQAPIDFLCSAIILDLLVYKFGWTFNGLLSEFPSWATYTVKTIYATVRLPTTPPVLLKELLKRGELTGPPP
jgi:hypothetical protein